MTEKARGENERRWEIRQSLVERLRIPWEGMGDMANQQRAEAAVQISTMMDEIEAWRQAAQKADRDIAELRAERDKTKDRPDGYWWGNESDQLAKLEAVVLVEALKIAEKRGWGRFKEKP